MTEKINLNPTIKSIFNFKNACKKAVLNDDIKDTYIVDGYMFVKEGFNNSLDKKVDDDYILNIKLKIKLEDIEEIDARITRTMLRNDRNIIYVNSKYYIYFKNICNKRGFTLKFSNVNDLPILFMIKEDNIIAGALGLRISSVWFSDFYKEKKIEDYKMELYHEKVKNEDIMNSIFSIYKKNKEYIQDFELCKEAFKNISCSKKDFKLKKDGIYYNYIRPDGKVMNDIPLFNKVISYGIVQNYQLLDEFWSFDIKTKKFLYDKILNFFIDYMENN